MFGLVGEHLPHSYSKIIHEFLGRYKYDLIELPPEEFGSYIANRQYRGLNITIPYKQEVMKYCDEVSPLAKAIGAVNTLYFKDDRLIGTNTDYEGFLYTCREIPFQGKKVLILGNGGTSLTVRKAAVDLGASEVLIASRRQEIGCISYDDLPSDAQIIINTTPVGMFPNNGQQLIALKDFPQCDGVVDVIYNPAMTDLLLQAKARGIPFSNGLPMLVGQAIAAFTLFTGEVIKNAIPRTISMLEARLENIVLIGMPGCGKSTFGRIIAKEMRKDFVDLDEEIEKAEGMTIPEIFAEKGEDYFRDLESKAARSFGKSTSSIISTGGGIVLREENMKALSQNGRVIFLQRPLNHLATKGRPLSQDAETLKTMYDQRFPLYNKYCDRTFYVEEGIEKNKSKLLRLIKGGQLI